MKFVCFQFLIAPYQAICSMEFSAVVLIHKLSRQLTSSITDMLRPCQTWMKPRKLLFVLFSELHALSFKPSGTGKTFTSATMIYHLEKQVKGEIMVCAPSKINVEQLSKENALNGLKVLRLVAKAWEAITSAARHLSLHYQLRHFSTANSQKSKRWWSYVLKLVNWETKMTGAWDRCTRILSMSFQKWQVSYSRWNLFWTPVSTVWRRSVVIRKIEWQFPKLFRNGNWRSFLFVWTAILWRYERTSLV